MNAFVWCLEEREQECMYIPDLKLCIGSIKGVHADKSEYHFCFLNLWVIVGLHMYLYLYAQLKTNCQLHIFTLYSC